MIGRKSFLIVLSRVSSAGLALVALFFITRYLGAEIYGIVTWAMALVATFNVVSDLGFDRAHIKRVSEGQNPNDCLATFATIKLLLTGLMVVTVLISIWIWTAREGRVMESGAVEIIILFILYFVFLDIARIATATFDANLMTAKTEISSVINILIRIPLVIFVSINRLEAIHLAFAYLIGALGLMIVALLLLFRKFDVKFRRISPRPTLLKSYARFALPFSIVPITMGLATTIDKLIIGAFWPSTEVGYYAASQALINSLSIVGLSVSILIFPTLSRMHANREMGSMRRVVLQSERYLAMFAFPVATLIVLFPTEISVILLGDGFAESSGPMRFLAVSFFFYLLYGISASQIDALERPGLRAKLILLSLTVNLVLLFFLVPIQLLGVELTGLGGTGAAMAKMAFFATLYFSSRYVVYRLAETGISPKMLLQLMAAFCTAVVLAILSIMFPLDDWVGLVLYAAASVSVFAAVLYLVGELKREDITYILRVISPRDMKDYLMEELRDRK